MEVHTKLETETVSFGCEVKKLLKDVLHVHGYESLFKGGRDKIPVWTLF